jgi:hypothetical protein
MLTDPGGLQTFLNGRVDYDCYETFQIASTTFSTRGSPPVRRGVLRSTLGDEVATCSFTILCGGGSSHLATAKAGTWDGADLVVSRVFVGGATLVRFRGVVADVRPSSTKIEIAGKSLLIELKKKIPARTFGSYCPYIWHDADCGTPATACEHSVTTCVTGNFGGFTTIPPESG